MNRYVSLLDKIRSMKIQSLLIYFINIHELINCIAVDIEIIDKLLIMDNKKYNIAVIGHFNKRNQIVISSINVRNPDYFT